MIGSVLLAALSGATGESRAQATTQPSGPKAAPAAAAASPDRPKDAAGRVIGPARAGWWNDGTFYQIFVRSFQDAKTGPLAGDGIGDLRGLIERLDYLNDGDPKTDTDLGVTGLWLLPIHPSPSYHGYDISDYFGINPQYGTMQDFQLLLAECHKRGIRVVLDLVLNHCSDEHPWFAEAKSPDSPKHDWFIWSTTNPGWKGPWNQTVWHPQQRGKDAGGTAGGGGAGGGGPYYYGIFSHRMPDLDYRNKEVSDQMLDVVRFWVNPPEVAGRKPAAADGYRLDAIRHLIEVGQVQENTPETHAWLREFQKAMKGANPESFSIGEVWTDSATASTYVGDEMDAVFEFDLSFAMVDAAKTGKANRVREAQEKVLTVYPPNQYGRFLTNHDQARVMTELAGKDPGAARVAAIMLLTGPGIPFIYYGEEIGMTGPKPDEKIRTPMQWSAAENAGFSTHKPWQAVNPGFETKNVAAESADPSSLLSLYRRLVHVRNANPALRLGAYLPVESGSESVYSFVRQIAGDKDTSAQTVLVAINLADKPVSDYALTLAESAERGPVAVRELAFEAPNAAGLQRVIARLNLNDRGGFTEYKPTTALPARSALIIELTSER